MFGVAIIFVLLGQMDSVNIWYSNAKKYIEAGRYDKALPLLVKSARCKPGDLSIQEELLEVALKVKDKEAEKFARRNLAKIYVQLGKNKLYSGNPSLMKMAIEDFRKALEYDTTYIDAYLYTAEYYWRHNHLDTAEIYYRKVTEIYPDSAQGWQGLGWLYGLLKKDYSKSVEYYNEALKKSPDNPDIIFGLAKVFEMYGKPSKADSLYKEAIKRKPENTGLIKSYGMFLSDTAVGRYTQSLHYLEKALAEKKEDKELHDRIVKVYLTLLDSVKTRAKIKKYSGKALKSLNWLINKNPENYIYYVNKAQIFEKLKVKDSVIFYYNRAYEFAPSQVKANIKIKLALYYLYDLKSPSKARLLLNEVLQKEYITQQIKATVYALIGHTYYFEAGQKMRIAKKTKGRKKRTIYKQAYELFQNAINYYNKSCALGNRSVLKTKQKAEELSKICFRKWKGIE